MNPEEQTFIYAYNITNYNGENYFIHNYTNETKSIEEDIYLYLGCTHASQCLFGSCTFIDEATNITPDIPFDNHPIGLCRYNTKANLTECDTSYMHCGKLEGASCSVVKYLDGTSDSDNLIIIVYIYLGITVLALVILCLSYCYYYIYQPKNLLYHIPITKATLNIRII
ncbi:hypothetical protein H8356DRAFT_1353422 [Neocallimastix lanati (nom. inval.)]|nr:hypothetical protein H8356DRAFT_1353422 [Neocallimastix sp. JGI-2020a]